MCKICTVEGCNNKVVAKGVCNKHYLELKRNGYIKDMVDCSNKILELGKEAIKDSGVYTDASLKEVEKAKSNIKEVKKIDGTSIVIKSNPMKFINAKTEEYTMLNGDVGMIKKVKGFRITDVVEPKYQLAAFKLSEAINSNNEIVSLIGIDAGEDVSQMPPASLGQIAKMLGYEPSSKRFKACIKSLIDSGILFKFTSSNKDFIDIYYFNPVFCANGKGVSPRLFFFFYKTFAKMAQQSDMFKFRFEQMAMYSLAWIAHKRADFKQVIEQREELGELETAKRLTAINKKIADEYGLNIDIQTEIEDMDKVDAVDYLEASLGGELSYSSSRNNDNIIEKAKVTPIHQNEKEELIEDNNCTSIPAPALDYDYDDMD